MLLDNTTQQKKSNSSRKLKKQKISIKMAHRIHRMSKANQKLLV